MKRLPAGLCMAAAISLAAAPAGAAPNIHPIVSTHGAATVVTTEGCRQTEIFVSSSLAMYADQPDPVGRQGSTAVAVRVTDTCSQPAGGGTVLYEADARNFAPLVADPGLASASVTTDLPGTDGAGNPVTVSLEATWAGTGPLFHDPVADITRMGATARVSVMVGALAASGTDSNAILEQVASRCIEPARPGVEDFFPCPGFPG
ncbi:hypothetical protein [Arthrobacter sp. C152]